MRGFSECSQKAIPLISAERASQRHVETEILEDIGIAPPRKIVSLALRQMTTDPGVPDRTDWAAHEGIEECHAGTCRDRRPLGPSQA